MLLIFRFFWIYFILRTNMASDESISSYTENRDEEFFYDEISNFSNEYIKTHEVVAGSNVLLTCRLETLGELLNVSWFRGREILTYNLNVISKDSRFNVILEYNLKINKVQMDDNSIFSCGLNDERRNYYYYYYYLDIFESSEKARAFEPSTGGQSLTLYAVINDTLILPCEGMHLRKHYLEWRKGANDIFSQESENYDKSRMKTLSGYTLEIQNVQYPDSEIEYGCIIQDPYSKNSFRTITHKIVVLDPVFNDTTEMCSPSPCGLNADCRPNSEYPECVCRHNFKGIPPTCEPVCFKNCTARLVCVNENCKKLREKTCGRNSNLIFQNYEYLCACSDNLIGVPQVECKSFSDDPFLKRINVTGIIGKSGKTYKGILNSSVIFSCEFSLSKKEFLWEKFIEFHWRFKPTKISFQRSVNFLSPRKKTYTVRGLEIKNVKYSDEGYYTCKLKNSLSNNIIYNLKIFDDDDKITKPNPQKSIFTIRVKKNETAVMPCEGTNNLDFRLITWIKSKEINDLAPSSPVDFKNSRFNIITGKSLEIQNLKPEDAGTYSCFLDRKAFLSRGNITLASYELKILGSAGVEDRLKNPCLKNPCGENSECYVKKGKAICSCRPNYIGAPPNCTEDCIEDKDCKELACLSETCENSCKASCLFHKNAWCRIQSYKWTCSCKDGFFENSANECVPEKSIPNNEETCGLECLLLSIGGPIVLLLLATTTTFTIITRKSHNRNLAKSLVNDVTVHRLNRYALYLSEYYDKKWEFSRNRLIIKEFIGEGHSGRVLKALAIGISGNQGTTIVAVKTLKKNATESQLDDLISEYQSLKELNHPNVIRFFGVCTKDGPLYIIMEFAENGSLRRFLQKIKKEAIPMPLDMERIYTPIFNNLQPKNILQFAWQISKGMSYLAEMKYVHRDLAARNILLTKDLICKISDFGLTRDVYRDGEYFRTSRGELPIKWIAIESLYTDSYSTKSDVWSFGIVLWELITFGANPYPGLHVRDIFNFLKEGKRMEKPEGCSDDFYKIMLSCWKEDPAERPNFQDLVDVFDSMLSAGVDYLQCNDEDQDGYLLPRKNVDQIKNFDVVDDNALKIDF